jgi:hypothetical protein
MWWEPVSAMYEVDQNGDAYREGLFARALGRSCDGNPYPEHSRDALLWIHGWWLIPDGTETAPAEEFEYESPSSLTHLELDEVSPSLSQEHERQPIRCLWIQTVEAVRHMLRGLLLAAAVFSLSYAVLHIFLLW